jgi:NO-binding membrane sensor protein with MHYT domain
LTAAPNAFSLHFATMSAAVLPSLPFVLLSSRLLSPGRSAITARLPAFAASRLLV